jgi:hypothetical protein
MVGMGPSLRDVLMAASRSMPVESLRLCKDPSLPSELLSMEERQVWFFEIKVFSLLMSSSVFNLYEKLLLAQIFFSQLKRLNL